MTYSNTIRLIQISGKMSGDELAGMLPQISVGDRVILFNHSYHDCGVMITPDDIENLYVAHLCYARPMNGEGGSSLSEALDFVATFAPNTGIYIHSMGEFGDGVRYESQAVKAFDAGGGKVKFIDPVSNKTLPQGYYPHRVDSASSLSQLTPLMVNKTIISAVPMDSGHLLLTFTDGSECHIAAFSNRLNLATSPKTFSKGSFA